MTPNEFKNVIDELNRFLHPKIATKPEQDGWWEKLKDLDGVKTLMAAKHITDTDTTGLMPSPGRIKAVIDEISGTKRITVNEAWAMVRDILSVYVTRDEIEALPDDVRKAAERAGRISYLATMTEEQARKAFTGAWYSLADTEHREEVKRLGGGLKALNVPR